MIDIPPKSSRDRVSWSCQRRDRRRVSVPAGGNDPSAWLALFAAGNLRFMPSEPARVDPRFPNLSPQVVEGYLSAPEHLVVEVLDGQLHTLPRPRRQHARGATRLAQRLRPFDDPEEGEPGGWVILIEPELHLGRLPDLVAPDLAGWRRERAGPEFLAADAPAHIELAPDWVCEILSPRTEAIDRGAKMRLWRREGVQHVWLLSPENQMLEVYRLEAGRWVFLEAYEGAERVRAAPFEAVELPLGALWAR